LVGGDPITGCFAHLPLLLGLGRGVQFTLMVTVRMVRKVGMVMVMMIVVVMVID
jgi:hypothetical protein